MRVDTPLLETVWDPSGPVYRLRLTNRGSSRLAGYRLGLSGPARLSGSATLTGGVVVAQLSNYAEIAPPEGHDLAPGACWDVAIEGLDYPIRHWTDGTASAFLIHADGSVQPVATRRTQLAGSLDRNLRGTADFLLPDVPRAPFSIIPWPREVALEGRRSVPAGLAPSGDDRAGRAFRRLSDLLFPGEGLVRSVAEGGYPVELLIASGQAAEAYEIDLTPSAARVSASTHTGLVHGLVTLGQMLRGARHYPDRLAFPSAGRISDAPAMGWRGCHLDVARRFYAQGEIERFLAILAWNKLNVLHWHLSDDEAFRVEINALPQIAAVAGWRGHGLPIPPLLGSGPERTGGLYTASAIREIVAFATELGIDVVPEIDMPGHCYALLRALPHLSDPGEPAASYHSVQAFPNNCLNPAVEAVYPAVETILDEFLGLFPSRYFHVGADEVPHGAWSASPLAQAAGRDTPSLQAHFLRRVQRFLSERGRTTGAWEEAAQGGGIVTSESYLVGWQNVSAARELAARGYDVVAAPAQAYYLDMALGPQFHECGAGWAGFSSTEATYLFDPVAAWSASEREHLKGIQACIWSEPMLDHGVFDRLVFPRLSAIAETGWTASDRRSWPRFAGFAGLMPNLYGIAERSDR